MAVYSAVTQCDSDKVKLYKEVRKRVTAINESDVGPDEFVPSKPYVEDAIEDESKVYIYKNIVDKDKDMVKLGDNSIKEN